MDITAIASGSAAVAAVAAFAVIVARPPSAAHWQAPVLLGLLFTAWTIYSVVVDGPFGFLPQHVGSPWESQITMDLLIMAGTAWLLLQPRLRAVDINPLPWLPLILATGSIAMLALVAYLLRTEAARRASEQGQPVEVGP